MYRYGAIAAHAAPMNPGGGVPDEECTVLLLRMDRLSIGARGQLAIKLKQLQLIVVNSGARTSEGVKKARVTKS